MVPYEMQMQALHWHRTSKYLIVHGEGLSKWLQNALIEHLVNFGFFSGIWVALLLSSPLRC